MNNRLLILLLLFTGCMCLQQACSQTTQPLVSGTIAMQDGWRPRLYLVHPQSYTQILASYESAVVDSADVAADGRFSFPQRPWLRETGLYTLLIQPKTGKYRNEIRFHPQEENFVSLILSPGSHVRLQAEAAAFTRSCRLLEADADNRSLAAIRDVRYQAFAQAPPADTLHHQAPESAQLDVYLDTVQTVLPALTALRLRASDNEFRDKPEFFLNVYDRLHALEPSNPLLAQFSRLLDSSKLPVLLGEVMPDFALPDTKGKILHLRDVQAPLLLVDFWASWCAPCRAEIRETIRPLYDAYHAKGFSVVGISIDSGRDAWMNAINKDGAIWPNASDLLGDASPVREALRFVYIPNNYLLDGEGRLIGRNLHKEELAKFVREYFDKK